MIGRLAKTMMKRTIGVVGSDGTVDLVFREIGPVTYDPQTGTSVRNDTDTQIGRAIKSRVTQEDLTKFGLTKTTHKVVVDSISFRNGVTVEPSENDRLVIDGKEWFIDKVISGSMDQYVKFFVCEA